MSGSISLEGVPEKELRGIFSTKVLRDIATSGVSPILSDLAAVLIRTGRISGRETLADLYSASFTVCAASEKSEYVYKNALVEKYLFGRHSLRTAAALFEIAVGTSKLDALLITDAMAAFEIKTERDELGRLEGQVRAYQRAFPRVWLFTCDRHVVAAEKILPPEVGLAVLTKRYRISVLRPALTHDSNLDRSTMFRMLRQAELLRFLAANDAGITPNTRVLSRALEIAASIEPVAINRFVASQLKSRATANVSLAAILPRPLAALALALRLSSVQSQRLADAMEIPLQRVAQ